MKKKKIETRGRKTNAPVTKKKLLKLVRLYGSATKLAKVLGISRSSISNWLHTDIRMPISLAVEIEVITKGKFKRTDFGKTYTPSTYDGDDNS